MVHLPPNFSTTLEHSLVISLHGGSGNMVNAQGFSMLNPVADQNNFIVAWPQGIGIAPPGYSWADGRNTSADQAGIDDVGFIDKLIDTLITEYNIDTNRIYICGFSNGGFMVQRLACETPERFAAMASLGASMDTVRHQNCQPSKPVPMAFFNGTSDPAMPYYGGPMQNPQVVPVIPVDTAVQFWIDHNNCSTVLPPHFFPDTSITDSSYVILYQYTGGNCSSEVLFYKIINGGHTWPGVYVANQAAVLGNTNLDIHASDELWAFFSQHTLCSTPTSQEHISDDKQWSVYPNPTDDAIYFTNTHEAINYSISNTHGQIVLSGIAYTYINVSMLPPGVYCLLAADKSSYATFKIVKY